MGFTPADRKASEVPEGGLRLAKVGEAFVMLSNVDGAIYATSRTCPHAGAALNYGYLEGSEVMCALHGAMFDVITGEVVMGPAPHGLRVFPIKVEGDDVLVDVE